MDFDGGDLTFPISSNGPLPDEGVSPSVSPEVLMIVHSGSSFSAPDNHHDAVR